MEHLIDINIQPKNWFAKRIKKYQVITFTFGFLLFYHTATTLIAYFTDKEYFIERSGLNIWFWSIGIHSIYFIQWFLVTWLASRLQREKLKQRFLKHPIATIILFILYLTGLPYRLAEYSGSGIISIFETILYYAFVSFLWWLLVCWISSKIFKNQRLKWRWYRKVIEKVFVIMPIAYKFIFGLIIALILFYSIFILITVVFRYSGQDLKILLS